MTQHLQTEKYERSANGRVTKKEQQENQGMDIRAQGFTRDALVVPSLCHFYVLNVRFQVVPSFILIQDYRIAAILEKMVFSKIVPKNVHYLILCLHH